MRSFYIERDTAETSISVSVNLDGNGIAEIATDCGFLDHMLTLFAKHGRFDLTVSCKGDTQIDDHHTVEDIGICLGKAFAQALGDKRGIVRYGNMLLPMDEALVLSVVDLSGRGGLYFDMQIPTEKVGTFDTELVKEFWIAFAQNACLTLHIRQLTGDNSHHIIEAAFKSVARSLRQAVAIDPLCSGEIPSTKGTLV